MNQMRLDSYRLEWLVSYLAVVDYGGFAAAAEATFRSQPRISTHVADLEKHLGAQLFDRRTRPVRLTEAGIAFLEHARAVVRSLESGNASVQAVLGLLRGTVRLAWHPSAGAAFGPALLREFAELHPHVTVDIVEGTTEEIATALHNGEADLALRPLLPAPRENTIQHFMLWEEPLVAVLPLTHRLVNNDYVALAEISGERIVTIGAGKRDPDAHHEVYRALRAAGIAPVVAFETNSPQTLIGLAREGLGIGLTNLLATAAFDTGGVAVIPLQDSGNRREVGVFWDAARPVQAASRALMDLIVQMPAPEAVRQYQRGA